ncbi:MFS transporter [Candidatus Bathyarchaeota archaeon]|nr:MFS transporter [Candidatus Bathyarchaeota archaeon]
MDRNIREYYLMIISGTLTMFAGGFVWPIFAAYVRTEFTAPLQLVGLAVSGYFLLRMFTEFPIGVIGDKIGPKLPLIAGRVLAVIGAFICYKTTSIWMLIFARIIWGMGDASFFCIGMTYVSKLFTSEKRGRALGVFQAVEMIGSFLGQTIGGYVAGQYGTRANFLATTLMAVVALASVTLIKGDGSTDTSLKGVSLLPSREDLMKVVNRTVIVACIINLVCMMNNNGIRGTLLPIYVTEVIGIELTRYAFLVSGSTVGSVSGNLIGGYLSDRIGRKRVLLAGLGLGAISLSGISIFTGFYPLLFMMVLNGVFWGIVYGVVPAYIADAVPDEVRGIGIGTFRTFMDLGGLIGPLVMTSIAEFVGGTQGYIYTFYFGIVMILGLIVITTTLKDTATLISSQRD